MKLLYCPVCNTVTNIALREEWTECECGNVKARYIDPVNAEWNGKGILLGFSNTSLVNAVVDQIDYGDRPDGLGRRFEAFIIPLSAPSVTIVEEQV